MSPFKLYLLVLITVPSALFRKAKFQTELGSTSVPRLCKSYLGRAQKRKGLETESAQLVEVEGFES